MPNQTPMQWYLPRLDDYFLLKFLYTSVLKIDISVPDNAPKNKKYIPIKLIYTLPRYIQSYLMLSSSIGGVIKKTNISVPNIKHVTINVFFGV